MTSKHNRPTQLKSRRQFIKASLTTGAVASTGSLLTGCGDGSDNNNQISQNNTSDLKPQLIVNNWASVDDLGYSGDNPYLHGVASGDPLPDRVILWTRISIPTNNTLSGANRLPVGYRVSRTPEFNDEDIVQQGELVCYGENDYTVKVDAKLPETGTHYYYRFEALGYYSPVGRTKTAPAFDSSPENVRFAVCSCANYPYGFFNAYAIMAQQDVDAVIHLGDYIYEYEQGGYDSDNTNVKANRVSDPTWEIVTLEDYRTRYAQYRTDKDLQECHRQHPFITVWDDHEIADNAYRSGAKNHTTGYEEGTFLSRSMAAVRAYHEWLPIRSESVTFDTQLKIYRNFIFGDLLSLNMLDTRLYGRDEQSNNATDPDKRLLGDEQWLWLQNQLVTGKAAGYRWQLLGQQIIFSPVVEGIFTDNLQTDIWDRYQFARNRVFETIENNAITNTIVLTGDYHTSFCFDVAKESDLVTGGRYDADTGESVLAVELACPAVTSPSIVEPGIRLNPHLKYYNGVDRGFYLLDLSQQDAQVQYCLMKTINERSLGYRIEPDAVFFTLPDTPFLQPLAIGDLRYTFSVDESVDNWQQTPEQAGEKIV